MFRSFARDVVVHRSLAPQQSSLLARRGSYALTVYLRSSPSLSHRLSSTSTPPPQRETFASKDPAQYPLHKISSQKPNVNLRPGPIKPEKPLTSITTSSKVPLTQPKTPNSTPASVGPLQVAKETAYRDVENAEAHGILTPPPPDATWFKRILHKGIQLAKFYYRGVKLIFVRRKQISLIRTRIKEGGAPLSRWEYRLIRTQKDDIKKVIPFLVIALLLEEVIPLIAIYAPFMLPSTCILPSQRARIEAKKAEAALAAVQKNRSILLQLKRKESPAGYLPINELSIDGTAATTICGILRLSAIGPTSLRIRRIRQHLEFIAEDDTLLSQDQMALPEPAVDDALAERGLISNGIHLKLKLARLQWWLDSVKNDTANSTAEQTARRLSLLISRL